MPARIIYGNKIRPDTHTTLYRGVLFSLSLSLSRPQDWLYVTSARGCKTFPSGISFTLVDECAWWLKHLHPTYGHVTFCSSANCVWVELSSACRRRLCHTTWWSLCGIPATTGAKHTQTHRHTQFHSTTEAYLPFVFNQSPREGGKVSTADWKHGMWAMWFGKIRRASMVWTTKNGKSIMCTSFEAYVNSFVQRFTMRYYHLNFLQGCHFHEGQTPLDPQARTKLPSFWNTCTRVIC